ncbi:MAG: hypothetical protein M0Z33_10175 [Actinomycetota bacterium]|nr:hypothetical protein [Actinomycetota bacterium]
MRLRRTLRLSPEAGICHSPEVAARDAAVRADLVAHLGTRIEGSDEWPSQRRDELVGELRTTPGLHRLLRRTGEGKLRVDKAAVAAEVRYDDDSLSAADLALGYKQLSEVELGGRDLKGALRLRPVFHRREDRIRAQVQLCWLALLLVRTAENATGDTWRNLRHLCNEVQRMRLVTHEANGARVTSRTATTEAQRAIFATLEAREPAAYQDFTLPGPVA